MTVDEIKMQISKNTGIPVNILSGSTREELLQQAEELLAFKASHRKSYRDPDPEPEHLNSRQTFALWFNSAMNGDLYPDPDPEPVQNNSYPIVRDGGQVDPAYDPRTTRQQFADWFTNISQFNPRESHEL